MLGGVLYNNDYYFTQKGINIIIIKLNFYLFKAKKAANLIFLVPKGIFASIPTKLTLFNMQIYIQF